MSEKPQPQPQPFGWECRQDFVLVGGPFDGERGLLHVDAAIELRFMFPTKRDVGAVAVYRFVGGSLRGTLCESTYKYIGEEPMKVHPGGATCTLIDPDSEE